MAKSVYIPDLQSANKRIDLKAMTGFAQKAPWNSPNAESMLNATMDLELCNILASTGRSWTELNSAWWTVLMQGGGMLVKAKDTVQWYYTLDEP